MNSAFKEGTQGGYNAQDRFCAQFQALYASGMHKNEQLPRSQMDFLQGLND